VNKTLKIACYGFVRNQSGSGEGARFLILEELLKRGCQIDFYNVKDFIYPQELFRYRDFRYIDIPNESLAKSLGKSFLNALPGSLDKIIEPLVHLLVVNLAERPALRRAILTNHQVEKYDLIFFLGLFSPFRAEDIPIISWPQGPPQTEWFFIQKQKKNLISLCGITLYVKLMLYYAFKAMRARAEVKISDIVICGSQWSKEQLILAGIRHEAIKILPYPMDTDFFKVNHSSIDQKLNNRKTFLWLGRIDPRKRLDLLLEAYELLLKDRQDVQLKIIGKFSYTEGYKKLIDRFRFPNYLEYQTQIDRSKIPELMAKCDILIQPSEGENFGSSVAEALCCGLPVIVGSTNGTKDYISSSSFIFEGYEPEPLKKAMLQAIQAVEKDKKRMALEARQSAEKNFNVSTIVDSLQDIFQQALKRQNH